MEIDCGPCRVRHWRRADEPALLRHANNRKVWRNLADRFPHPYTKDDAQRWFSLLEQRPEPTHWAIEVDGEAAGGIGVDPGEGIFAHTGRVGYWLGESFWGRGLMTAAVQATSNYLLTHTGLLRLESPVFEWNPASMRVLEKCGFQREGVLRRSIFKDGEVIDAVLYAKLR